MRGGEQWLNTAHRLRQLLRFGQKVSGSWNDGCNHDDFCILPDEDMAELIVCLLHKHKAKKEGCDEQ